MVQGMITCIDVHYKKTGATAAGLLFENWPDENSISEIIVRINQVKPYEPGRFYRRELPCLLRVIDKIHDPLEAVLIDGYVWLDENVSPGLGAYLYKALDESVPVIGVAKSPFRGSVFAQKVFRGRSKSPLYVTAVGMAPRIAAESINRMHGAYRIPTMLKKVDQLCRSG